jgi:hypothetical protein
MQVGALIKIRSLAKVTKGTPFVARTPHGGKLASTLL